MANNKDTDKDWETKTEPLEACQVISGPLEGFAYSLVVAYCTGLDAGASITLDEDRVNKSYLFGTKPFLPGQKPVLQVFQKDTAGGGKQFIHNLELDAKTRPFYILQKEQYQKGANQQHASSDVWTGVFNYTQWHPLQGQCGFAKSLPIPSCLGCNGFCGAIGSHVSLVTIRRTLEEGLGYCFCFFSDHCLVGFRGTPSWSSYIGLRSM